MSPKMSPRRQMSPKMSPRYMKVSENVSKNNFGNFLPFVFQLSAMERKVHTVMFAAEALV